MAMSVCPRCDKSVDIDGYVEHGVRTLFYCECGAVLDMPKFGELVEVPIEEVDLSGLEGRNHNPQSVDWLSGGLFIKKSR